MVHKLIRRFARTDFARAAVAEKAELAMLKGKPTPRVIAGLAIIGISYVIGWPVIALLGVLAAHSKEPLIIIVGGPADYLLSHLVFLLGTCLAGTHYVRIVLRWAARMIVERAALD